MTVPEAARRVDRDPETVRRWIRAGKLPARKIGTQHLIEERDLDAFAGEEAQELPFPDELRYFESGRLQPNWTAEIRRQRRGH